MTRIGLIADTHIPWYANKLPSTVIDVFQDVDLILHAGDLTTLSVINELRAIADVHAVHGNACSSECKKALPKITSLDIYGWHIGVTHGAVLPLFPGWYRIRMHKIADINNFDILVCGHIHKPVIYSYNTMLREQLSASSHRFHRSVVTDTRGILIVNPGSPTAPLWGSPATVAILNLTRTKRQVDILKVVNRAK
jgi:hypothetical protein